MRVYIYRAPYTKSWLPYNEFCIPYTHSGLVRFFVNDFAYPIAGLSRNKYSKKIIHVTPAAATKILRTLDPGSSSEGRALAPPPSGRRCTLRYTRAGPSLRRSRPTPLSR